MRYTYLLINLLVIIIPFVFSFENKIKFFSHWRAFAPAIIFTGLIFIIWDIIFTKIAVWSFNKEYITGLYIFDLPFEEILFFITVPYSSLFLFEVVEFYLPEQHANQWMEISFLFLALILAILGVINIDRLYTGITFLSLSFAIFLSILVFKFKKLRNFSITYFLTIIPFLIFNGLLTSIPVVMYNNSENLGIRFFTIPIEDTFYGMLLIFVNILIYTRLKK